jgi:hypothetical protein
VGLVQDVGVHHIDPDAFVGEWMEIVKERSAAKRSDWLHVGARCGTLPRVPARDLMDIVMGDESPAENEARVGTLMMAGMWPFIEANTELSNVAIRLILEGRGSATEDGEAPTILSAFDAAIGPSQWVYYRRGRSFPDLDLEPLVRNSVPGPSGLCQDVLRELMDPGSGRPVPLFQALRSGPWSNVIERLRKGHDGIAVAVVLPIRLANNLDRRQGRLSAIASANLVDRDIPVLDRVIAARLRAGSSQVDWWQHQFAEAQAELDCALVATAALMWTSGGALSAVLDDVENVVDQLDEVAYCQIREVVPMAGYTRASKVLGAVSARRVRRMSPRVADLLARSGDRASAEQLWEQRLSTYSGDDPETMRLVAATALARASNESSWEKALRAVRRSYKMSGHSFNLSIEVPPVVAEKIVTEPAKYPLGLVGAAEGTLATSFSRAARPMSAVARQERWFAVPN